MRRAGEASHRQQQKHSQSAEANAAAHQRWKRLRKKPRSASGGEKQQQAVDQAQNELNLVQASQEEKTKITIMHLQR